MRVVIRFKKDSDGYVNIEAEEFHEDGEYIKVYSNRHELVGMFLIEEVRAAWRSER